MSEPLAPGQTTTTRFNIDAERTISFMGDECRVYATPKLLVELRRVAAVLRAIDRIEIRGFGSFSLHFRPPRQGRNPKTGEAVALAGKYVPHFKPGKDLRERVNESIIHPIRD